MAQEADGLRQRCRNYDDRNAELQRALNLARAPDRIHFCRNGECYHGQGCNHTKDKQVNSLRKCKDSSVSSKRSENGPVGSAEQETDRSEVYMYSRNHS